MIGLEELNKIFKNQVDNPKDPYVHYNVEFAGVVTKHKHLSHELSLLVPQLRNMKVMSVKDNVPTFVREGL